MSSHANAADLVTGARASARHSSYNDKVIGERRRPTIDHKHKQQTPSPPTPKLQHLLANDLAELVHIFKENVVVRHSPNPAGGVGGEEKNVSPKIYVPDPVLVLHGGKRRSREAHFSTANDWQDTIWWRPQRDSGGRVLKEKRFLNSSCCLSLLDPPAPSPPKRNAAQLRVNRHRRGSIIQFGSPPVPAPPSPFASRYPPPVSKKKSRPYVVVN